MRILASRAWTQPQRQWLEPIGQQMIRETLVDRDALDAGQFRTAAGGFKRLNKIFDDQLEQVLGELHDEVWRDAG